MQPDAIFRKPSGSSSTFRRSPASPPACTSRPALQQVFDAAFKAAEKFKDEFVSTEHLLLGIADQKYDPAGSLLNTGATMTRS